jgi:hypothetical protein
LDGYKGSWVVLFFYPRDFTFICPTELQAFAELSEAFADEGASLVDYGEAWLSQSYPGRRMWRGGRFRQG